MRNRVATVSLHGALACVSVAAVTLVFASPVLARPAGTGGTTVTVVAGRPSEFVFTLSETTIPVGQVRFKLTNAGVMSHAFKICSSPVVAPSDSCAGSQTGVVPPGGAATLSVRFKRAGTYEYLCDVPGQAAAGMKGLVLVGPN